MERLKQALSAAGIAYKENEPLSAHCTFRIGGPADVFILPENEAQLCAAIKLAKEANVKYYLLGNGSNILFEYAGYRGWKPWALSRRSSSPCSLVMTVQNSRYTTATSQ